MGDVHRAEAGGRRQGVLAVQEPRGKSEKGEEAHEHVSPAQPFVPFCALTPVRLGGHASGSGALGRHSSLYTIYGPNGKV